MPDDRREKEWDPRKSPREVVMRRLKRRIKAAASIGLALAAGTFLSLQRPARADSTPPPGGESKKKQDKGKGDHDKSKGDKKKGKVDKDEHRKGMPVRDNLLE
jgi:hypothetical protein